MFAEEWPLMMFTLLTQLAVGSFFMLVLIRSYLSVTYLNLTSKDRHYRPIKDIRCNETQVVLLA